VWNIRIQKLHQLQPWQQRIMCTHWTECVRGTIHHSTWPTAQFAVVQIILSVLSWFEDMHTEDLTEVICYTRQSLNDVIFISLTDKNLFTLAIWYWKTHRITDYMYPQQQSRKTSEQNAFFAQNKNDAQPVADGICWRVETGLHQFDIR